EGKDPISSHSFEASDSISQYHPFEGGCDLFFFVKEASPRAEILSSSAARREMIERTDQIDYQIVSQLIRRQSLSAGQLLYVPRGVMYRFLGQSQLVRIAIPELMPGQTIGLDHRIKVINDTYRLSGDQALPFHFAASHRPLIK
ncbi:MAG: hypothetical protein AAFQ87_28520, partial [Bacteroidota bacterium]